MASREWDQSAQHAERAAGMPSDQAGQLLLENVVATKMQVKQCKELVADFLRKTLTKKPLARRLPFNPSIRLQMLIHSADSESRPAANGHAAVKVKQAARSKKYASLAEDTLATVCVYHVLSMRGRQAGSAVMVGQCRMQNTLAQHISLK